MGKVTPWVTTRGVRRGVVCIVLSGVLGHHSGGVITGGVRRVSVSPLAVVHVPRGVWRCCVYTSMYVCMHVWMEVCMYRWCVSVCPSEACRAVVSIEVCMYACMDGCLLFVCTAVRIRMPPRAVVCRNEYVYMYGAFVRVEVCVCVCVCLYACMCSGASCTSSHHLSHTHS